VPADHHAADRAHGSGEPGDQAALEQLGEQASELVSLGGRPRVPLALERRGGGPADVGDLRHEVLDAGDFLERRGAGGRVVDDDVDRAEEVAQTVRRRPGKRGRPGQQQAHACHGGGEQTSGTPREVHMSNIGCSRGGLI